ncbi:hypothetical protein O6H91_05G116500 [Diphasiastrum complanatum]|uniref:Uncharacterized protein n=2 Tax=Diphasiastrum complanatum TaxID=34168 RepID=A0ACC2DSB4_DIPCM|nr:hypothetical protein O6H91_05G116500 [Diphasiastrum complanatum]KAJ7557204.1 hypothetical protein O6H91_05G116500 [Diphasiastrum complanatum]
MAMLREGGFFTVTVRLLSWLLLVRWTVTYVNAACLPLKGCTQALAVYNISQGDQLTQLYQQFSTNLEDLRKYNNISDPDQIIAGDALLIPFTCNCLGDHLGFYFPYDVLASDTVYTIASMTFENLSRQEWIASATPLVDINSIFPGLRLKVPVNCSCGDPSVGLYGLFATYVVQSGDTLEKISQRFKIASNFLTGYNPKINWKNLTAQYDILFVPAPVVNGVFPQLNSSFNGPGGSGSHTAAIIGGSVGGGIALLIILGLVVFCLCLPRKGRDGSAKLQQPLRMEKGLSGGSSDAGQKSMSSLGSAPGVLSDFAVDKSVEFSYEELAAATSNFSIANKIGEGGYGSVYYAELRGQKVAVKRMNLQATKEFLSELKVLTHVHHTNLVQLIGYCTVESLFLIYEFVENGTLAQHLHGSGRPPLSWPSRVQIALDAARGLEYIHEHTKPTYIHRDVKSSNILIDKHFHAKVADFGLTKLTESGMGSVSMTQPTRLVGTFGYMSPEYARFGDVSPKVDVYSFGVVLFEIISAKEAIVRTANTSSIESSSREEHKGLVTLFESVLKDRDGKEKVQKLVDPALNSYPLDSAWKMAQLAGACTQENPELRPSMRTAVVALMTLSSSTQDWEINVAGDNGLGGLVSGR